MMVQVPKSELIDLSPPNITSTTVNPYLVYQETLRIAFYPQPPPGFAERLWTLIALTLVGICLVLARYVLLGIDNRRRKTHTWWWRTVKQSSGTFLVLGHDALTQSASLVTSLIFLADLLMQCDYLLRDYELTGSAAWKAFGWLSMILQVWLMAWCSLFSRLVVSESKGRPWPKWVAPGSQIIFVVFTVALLVPYITTATLSVIRWKGVWTDYLRFEALLEESIPLWTGADDARLVDVKQQLHALVLAATRHYNFDLAFKVVNAIFLFVTQLVNLAGLQIYGTIRRQIKQNIEMFGNHNPSYTNQTTLNAFSTYNNTSVKLAPTPQNIKMASRDNENRFADEAKRIRDLQRASNNTLIRTTGVLIQGMILFAIFCWKITVPSVNFNSSHVSWVTIELATFLPIWVYQISIIPITASYIYTLITHMPPKGSSTPKKPPPEDTLDAFFFQFGGSGEIIPIAQPTHQEVMVHLPPTPLQVHLNLLSEK